MFFGVRQLDEKDCGVAKKYGFETEPLEGSFEELLEEEICVTV